MGAARDDLQLDDEEREIIQRRRANKKETKEREEIERTDRNVRSGAAAARLLNIVTGEEKPRRESLDDYMKRRGL